MRHHIDTLRLRLSELGELEYALRVRPSTFRSGSPAVLANRFSRERNAIETAITLMNAEHVWRTGQKVIG